MTKRGRVLRDTNVGPGLLTVDGRQYSFLLEGMWRSEVPPRTGMAVDVNFNDDGAPTEVHAVSEAQVAREQAQRALGGALKQGESAGSGLWARFGSITIVAQLVLLLSFFGLPNLGLEAGYSGRSISGWDAVAMNPATGMTGEYGLESMLAIACFFAPAAIAFLKQAWSRWLYAAPLAFCGLALVIFATEIHSANAQAEGIGQTFGGRGSDLARQFGPHYTVGAGAYLTLLCSIYLATRVFASRNS